MHGLSRLSNGTSSSSPSSSPCHRPSRGKTAAADARVCGSGGGSFRVGGGGKEELKSVVERFGYFLISIMHRRRRMLLFAPLFYISGMLMYMGTLGFDVVNNNSSSSRGSRDVLGPGSVCRSPRSLRNSGP